MALASTKTSVMERPEFLLASSIISSTLQPASLRCLWTSSRATTMLIAWSNSLCSSLILFITARDHGLYRENV